MIHLHFVTQQAAHAEGKSNSPPICAPTFAGSRRQDAASLWAEQ